MTVAENLRSFVREHATNRPGVYTMLGPDAAVLYVGKSVRMRTRLLSYFRAEPGNKAHTLMRETVAIRWEYVPNEFGALVKEMKLIQRCQPRYNVQHKRRRSYAFIRVTREPAPRLVPVRRVIRDGSTYYGPFPAARWLADAIRDLAHVLELRDCAGSTPMFFNDQTELFTHSRPPSCVRHELGTCLSPCSGGASSRDYGDRVQQARAFLEARSRKPVGLIRERMQRAADRRDFEYAAALRDRAERLDQLQRHLAAFRGHVRELSFVYRVPGWDGDDRLYLIRNGRIHAEFGPDAAPSDPEAAEALLDRIFRGPDVGGPALRPDQAAEVLLVARWFRLNPEQRAHTMRPAEWMERLGVGRNDLRFRSVPTPADDSIELALPHRLNGKPGVVDQHHVGESLGFTDPG